MRLRETTRGGNLVPQTTPFQLQKSSEPSLHECRVPKGSKLMPDLKQRRARRSISDMFACAAASIEVLKQKRLSKIQNRGKSEGMMSM